MLVRLTALMKLWCDLPGVGEGPRQCEGPVQAGPSLHDDTGLHRGQAGPQLGHQGRARQQVLISPTNPRLMAITLFFSPYGFSM